MKLYTTENELAAAGIKLAEQYGANAFLWPLNDETKKYFDSDYAIYGSYSEAAETVLGLRPACPIW
jgi:hypothetical protein